MESRLFAWIYVASFFNVCDMDPVDLGLAFIVHFQDTLDILRARTLLDQLALITLSVEGVTGRPFSRAQSDKLLRSNFPRTRDWVPEIRARQP